MIKAIIFDLDQTLINFLKMKKTSLREAIDGMIDAGLDMDADTAFDIIWDLYDEFGIEDNQIFQKFLEKVIGKVDYRILAYGVNAYRRVKNGFLSAYPGTKRTLIKLRQHGLKLAIVSDAPRLKCWLRLTSMKIDDFFDVVVSLDDTGSEKPSRLPFEKAVSDLNLKPEECIMVGDNPRRDIIGASLFGMKTCLAKYGQVFSADDVKPDFEITRITDLVSVVEKLDLPR